MVLGEGEVEELGAELQGEGTIGPADNASIGLFDLRRRKNEFVFWAKEEERERTTSFSSLRVHLHLTTFSSGICPCPPPAFLGLTSSPP